MSVIKTNLGPEHGEIVIRHSPIIWGLGAVVFLHGLGDSRQCFLEAFDEEGLNYYNLIAPDLPGCGNSQGGDELSITSLIHCVDRILELFKISEYIIVGHGLGADIATFLCQRDAETKRFKGLINIEGTIGEENLEFADMSIDAANDPKRTYYKWFRDEFAEKHILSENIQKWQSYRRYYESLTMCKPGTFLRLSRDMRSKLYINKGSNEIQSYEAFKDLDIPKYYCYGEHGFSKDNAHLLKEDNIPNLFFPDATHWLMIDQQLQFYPFLLDFCRKHMPQPQAHQRIRNWFTLRFKLWIKTIPKPRVFIEKIHHWIRTKIKY